MTQADANKLNSLLKSQAALFRKICTDIDKTLGMVNTALVEYHSSMSEEQLWADDKKVQTSREKAYIKHFAEIKQNLTELARINETTVFSGGGGGAA